jgi:phosphotransferase family enzyme
MNQAPVHPDPSAHSTAATVLPGRHSAGPTPMRLVLLAAGHVRQDFVSLMDVTSPAMLPYMGRPLIYITVLNFLKQGGRDVTIVIPEGEKRVEAFLRSSFGTRMTLSVVRAPNRSGATPLQSLEAALDAVTEDGLHDSAALIAHGDIYYEVGPFDPGTQPVVFTSAYIDSDKYSSIHVTEGGYLFEEAWAGTKSSQLAAQQAKSTYTDIGLYYVPSATTMRQALKQAALPASTVGALLFQLYGRAIALQDVEAWIDLGHLDTSARIRTHVLGTRECNHLDIDEMRGLITKRGRNQEKLLQEINYYNRLPKELTVYFPRMLESRLGKDVSYTIEYYGYKTLSEYLVFYEVPKTVWQQVLVKILSIHKAFRSRAEQEVEPERVYEFYWKKTEKRLNERARLTAIQTLLDADHVVINGIRYPGWQTCRPAIQARIKDMAARCTTSVIHGDLCCGNILYDPRTSLIKFIDPRGDFFEEGCHGDPRYDMAKLLHSFHGGYDFILHEMYQLSMQRDGHYEMALLRSDSARDAEQVLFQLLASATSYQVQDLLTLEALLFLTMLPFHCDDGKRQTALYLRGLMLLKEAFGENLS